MGMKKSEVFKSTRPHPVKVLHNIPFFAHLSDEEISSLSKIILRKTFSKNETILWENDTPRYMYIVYSGKIKVMHTSFSGKERILAFHKEGDFFGEMALLDGKTSPATVIAMQEADIGLISKDAFERIILKNEKVLKGIIDLICSRLRDSWLMLKLLSFADAEQRVRALLQYLSMQNGKQEEQGTLISLKLTHQDIADYASLSRETVTRLFDRFIKGKEIAILENRCILLKPSFSEKLADL